MRLENMLLVAAVTVPGELKIPVPLKYQHMSEFIHEQKINTEL